jgi:hypothetical protein
MDRTTTVIAVAEAVDVARAAAVAAVEAKCVASVAEKEARAAVQSATIAADKVQLVVDAVKYQIFVEDNSMVDSLVTDLLSLLLCCCSFKLGFRVSEAWLPSHPLVQQLV